jgi:hypothetical protein
MCDHPRSSAPGLLILPRYSSLPAMPHPPPVHHVTNKCDSPNETKIKVKPRDCPRFEFKHCQVNDSSQSNHGVDHLVSQSPTWWVHWHQKAQSLKFESKTPWSTDRSPKSQKKAQEGHLDEGKATRPTKGTKSDKPRKRVKKSSKPKQKEQKKLKLKNSKLPLQSTPPNTLNASSPPYIDIIMFLLSTTQLAKSSTNFVHILSPFGNELIRHKLREEWDSMHEIKIRVLHKAYKHVFKQLYPWSCQDLQNKSEST